MTFRPSPSPDNPSASYIFMQALCTLGFGAMGLLVGMWLLSQELLVTPINLAYMSLLGLLVGYLLGLPISRWWEKAWRSWLAWLRNVPAGAVVAAGIGAIVALIITVLLNSILENVPGFSWYWSLGITLFLTVASMRFFVLNREVFGINPLSSKFTPLQRLEQASSTNKAQEHNNDKVIDTSALIDGRIVDILQSNFLQGRILVPQMILHELQHIADSSDPLRRKKGRRGLEMLERLQQQDVLDAIIINEELQSKKIHGEKVQEEQAQINSEAYAAVHDTNLPVDERLVILCQQLDADLITTDFNLGRIASLQSVRVLNINQLANMLRAVLLPGENLRLELIRAGREAGQALAYLEDGTMIVVENAADRIGQKVDVQVTSSLQTNVGRMIFARLDEIR